MKQRIQALVLCAVLGLSLTACTQETSESQTQVSTSSQNLVESQASPSPTPTPTPSPTPTPAPTATPAPTQEPVSSQPAGDFDALFAENPIYDRLEEDLLDASSTTRIQQAYDNAIRLWQQLIDTAYSDSQQVCPAEEAAQIQQEQEEWESSLDGEIETIRQDYSAEPLSAYPGILELYRQRAEDLCRAVYNATGELPAFPDTSGTAAG